VSRIVPKLFHNYPIQLRPPKPVVSTNKTPCMECIIPFIIGVKTIYKIHNPITPFKKQQQH
jgi:hypothetical protein